MVDDIDLYCFPRVAFDMDDVLADVVDHDESVYE
jgi:hypothetical protein